MIAGVPPGFQGNEVSGQIWRNNAPLAREIVAAVSDELKEVHGGKLFPFEFDAGDDYGTNWKMFAGVMAMFGGCGLILSFTGVGGVIQGFRPATVRASGQKNSRCLPETTAVQLAQRQAVRSLPASLQRDQRCGRERLSQSA